MKNYIKININSIKKTVMSKQVVFIILTALLITSCGSGNGSDKKTELDKLKKEKAAIEAKILVLEEELAKTDSTVADNGVEVLVSELKPSVFKSFIEVQGRVDAEESVSLSSEIPGTITKILVKAGDRVSKGQTLAETDARATQQQLSDLQTNLALASQVYEKQKSLWDQKIGTEVQYLQAKTNKESLEIKIAALQEQLKMSKIISPIDGTVDGVEIKLGQSIAPGMSAITVVNFSNLKVKAEVAESYASRIKSGDEVLILFPDMKDSVSSKINYAARAIKPLSRTFAVEVLLDDKKEYHPNTVARLKINDYKSSKPEIVVPVKYIQKGAESSFVMIDVNGKAVSKIVKIGREYSGMAEITEGLNEGDLLITEGYDLVNDGTSIKSTKL